MQAVAEWRCHHARANAYGASMDIVNPMWHLDCLFYLIYRWLHLRNIEVKRSWTSPHKSSPFARKWPTPKQWESVRCSSYLSSQWFYYQWLYVILTAERDLWCHTLRIWWYRMCQLSKWDQILVQIKILILIIYVVLRMEVVYHALREPSVMVHHRNVFQTL